MNKEKLENLFKEIMIEMGLDLKDDSLQGTPKRLAKMYSEEIFHGLKPENFPRVMTIENKFNYDQMLTEKGIAVNSMCEHHFLPIIGMCTVSYIPHKKVIGLSKLNRVVQYYCARPQVQERLTEVIKNKLIEILGTENVAICIDAAHMCVKMRGIKDHNAITRTTALGGVFLSNSDTRREFLNSIGEIKLLF